MLSRREVRRWFRGSWVPGFLGSTGFRGSLAALTLLVLSGFLTTHTGARTPAAAPNFAADIAPMIYANCTTCHRPGQSAPFSLLSYDDVKKRGRTIAEVTERRYMPPWHAARAAGFAELRDERRLRDQDIATIKAWVAADMPPGDLSKAPKPPVFPAGWPLGVPDLILSLPNPITVPAEGRDLYRNVTLDVDLPVDRWILAIDYHPTARAVVHHALFFVEPSDVKVTDADVVPGLGRALLAGRGRAGGGARLGAADEAWGGLGGWVPGVTPRFFPDGVAQPMPKHSNVIMQMHLHPSGKEEREAGQLGLYFAKTPPLKSLTGVQVPPAFGFAAGIDIPAGEARFVIKDSFVLPVDVETFGARGHAHYLGREMKLTATLPNGSTRGLLWIDKWDFAWQDSYYFKTPIVLPAGTRLDVELAYDNSTGNPRNPNVPPVRVKWGRESEDEMGSMTLLVAAPSPDESRTLRAAQAQHFREQLAKRLRR
jgi:mono/diheme cytochrome c family protein